MFMLIKTHKARMAAKVRTLSEDYVSMHASLGNRIDQARNESALSRRGAASAHAEVAKLCSALEVSQDCSSTQAAIIRDNNRLLAEHKAKITDLTNALNASNDHLRLARSQRGCAMEEKVFQQLGALLTEKPAADPTAEAKVLKKRIASAVEALLQTDLTRGHVIRVLQGVL